MGTYASSTNRYWGVKYIGEDTTTPGVVTCLSLLDGQNSAVAVYPQVIPATLKLTGKQLAASGLEWRECDDATEGLGTYGELTIINESASQPVFVTFEWDISFANLASSGLHLSPAVVKAHARAGLRSLAQLASSRTLPPLLLEQERKEDEQFELVTVRLPKKVVGPA